MSLGSKGARSSSGVPSVTRSLDEEVLMGISGKRSNPDDEHAKDRSMQDGTSNVRSREITAAVVHLERSAYARPSKKRPRSQDGHRGNDGRLASSSKDSVSALQAQQLMRTLEEERASSQRREAEITANYQAQCLRLQSDAQAHNTTLVEKYKIAEENIDKLRKSSEARIEEINREHAKQLAFCEQLAAFKNENTEQVIRTLKL